jgi:predicted  nucleic acid-binding Zn-ribbon protein
VVERRAESSALTTQLDSASTDLQRSRDERDAALTEKEGAIAKQIALEQELTELRVELQNNQVQASRFDIERADAASDLAAANERIAAAELQNAGFDEERASLRTQMDSIVAERDDAWQNMADNRTHTEDLANRLQVAEQARVDLETELADVSAKWQDLRVEMHSITEQRLAIETELQQLTETREASESNRAELFSELGSELGRVEAERDLLARKLELAQSRLADTRTVLEGATTSLTTELDGVDEAFGQTSQAAADLDRAVSGASQRLSDLEAEMSGAGIPDAGSLDTGSTSVVEHSQDASFSDDNASEQSDAANHQDLTIFGEPGPIAKAVVAPPVGEIAATLSPFASAAEPSEFIGDPAVDLPLEDPFKDIGEQDAAADDAGVVDEVDSFAAVDAPATDEADTRDLDDVLASYGLGAEEADVSDVYEVSDIADTTDQSTGPDPVSMMPDSPVESLPIEDAEVLGITDDSDELTALAYLPAPDPTDVALDDPAPVAAVAASGERRAQIAPISGDPLAVARHMVTTPEVVLLLVGDPIASLGWPSLGVAERRDALVSYLGDLAADTGAASDVVFDGTVGDETQLPVSRAVRVRLTHPGIEASAAAAEVIDQYPREWPVVVVSDDPSLTKSAIDKGASVLDNGQLLDLFYPS